MVVVLGKCRNSQRPGTRRGQIIRVSCDRSPLAFLVALPAIALSRSDASTSVLLLDECLILGTAADCGSLPGTLIGGELL